MEERSFVSHIKANRWVTFIVLLFVLAVGITIGTLVLSQVDAGRLGAEQLTISRSGKPLNTDSPTSLSEGFAEVAALVGPAVVNINTESLVRNRIQEPHGRQQQDDLFGFDLRRFFDAPEVQRVRALGSGFIVDSAGYIITNGHVIDGASKIKVNLKDGREFTAQLVGKDESTDIAVIKIESDKSFPYAKIGDSAALRAGDWAVAIGSPFDLAQTVTAGIISATGRVFSGVGIFNDYLQTDAAINRGNSGGPLVNMAGEVVGINTFIQSTTGSSAGVGFAVPSHTFVGIYNQLTQSGTVKRGWLGISMNTSPMTPEMAQYFGVESGKGVLITDLIDESGDSSRVGPAARAGLLPEDVIVEIDNRKIKSDHDLRTVVANTAPGDTVVVKAVRKGTTKTFNVALAERSIDRVTSNRSVALDDPVEESKPQEIGLTVDNLTSTMARQFQLDSEEGAIVVGISPGSLAEDAGLQKNDILLLLNGKPISSAQQFGQLFRKLKSGEGAVLKYVRVSPDGRGATRKLLYYTSLVKP